MNPLFDSRAGADFQQLLGNVVLRMSVFLSSALNTCS
jgi:hypothetical protein